jgi:hypothetical protein
MPAAYIDKNGDIRISFFCKNPKLRRRDRGHCGAKTRKGTPCKAPPVWDKSKDKARNGRCKLHGGLSTGPKTDAGRKAIRASNRRRRKI